MWLLYILLSLTMIASHNAIILAWRLNVAGAPITLYEIIMVLILLVGWFGKKGEELLPSKTPPLRTILVLWAVSISVGAALGLGSGMPAYAVIRQIKWWLKLPAGMACAYITIRTYKDVRRFVKLAGILSCVVCVLVLMFFSSRSGAFKKSGSANLLRTMDYNVNAAAIIGAATVFTATNNPAFYSSAVRTTILTMSSLAVLGTLTRSITLSFMGTIAAAIFIAPKGVRIRAWRVLTTSGIWIFIAVTVSAAASMAFLQVDVIAVIQSRFDALVEPSQMGSYMGRWEGAVHELSVWLHSTVIFGAGYGAFGLEETSDLGSIGHNAYTNMLAVGGLVGFVALMYCLWTPAILGRKMIHSDYQETRAMGSIAIASTVFFFFQCFMSAALANERHGLFLGLVLGATLKCYRFGPPSHERLNWNHNYAQAG